MYIFWIAPAIARMYGAALTLGVHTEPIRHLWPPEVATRIRLRYR